MYYRLSLLTSSRSSTDPQTRPVHYHWSGLHIIVCSYYYYLVIVGAEAVNTLSNRVSQISVQTRFMVDDDTWPPEQPKSFTPLLLVHYQGNRTLEQVKAMAELTYNGDIGKVASVASKHSAVTYNKQDGHDNFHKC